MRNIIGNPAEGDDFFLRPKVLSKLNRLLQDSGNVLLVAPRRVGKTSVVLRLCEEWKAMPSQKAVFLNVEGRSDELAFAEKLVEELTKAGLHPEMLKRVGGMFTKVRNALGGQAIKIPGLEYSLGEGDDPDHATLGKSLESIFRKIEGADEQVLIALDELPEFLLTLQKAENGPARVTAFLHRLRELRQTFRKKIRWVFLGSIGLDNFVADQNLQKLINDLQVFSLEAFTPAEADSFLRQLSASNELKLSDEQRNEIVRLVGWPLAYHLHLIYHELRDLDSGSIADAFESLLQPQKFNYFDTWNERLEVQFTAPDTATCKAILNHLCRHSEGRERGQILTALMARPNANADQVEAQLSRLIIVLQRDGYLLESNGSYAFRSFLLREYWRRRHGQ